MAEAITETTQEAREARVAKELIGYLSQAADRKVAADPERRSLPKRKNASTGVFYLESPRGFFMLRRCETRSFAADSAENDPGTLIFQDFWVTDLHQRGQERWHLLWDLIKEKLTLDWSPADQPMPLSVLTDPNHCFVKLLGSLKQGEGTIHFSFVAGGVSEDVSIPFSAHPGQE